MKQKGLLSVPGFVKGLLIFGVFTILFLASNILLLGGDEFFALSNTLIPPVCALLTSFLFFQASRNKQDVMFRANWSGMALGFFLWGLADLIWAYYSIVLNDLVPYPSIADLVWIIGYLPLYIALITLLRRLRIAPTLRQRASIIALNLIGVVMTVIYVLVPIVRDFESARLAEGVVSAAYPLADIGLLMLTTLILVLLSNSRYSLPWRLIAAGIFVMTFSDLLYSYASWEELYYPDGLVNLVTNVIDTSYSLAYIVVGLGIFTNRFIADTKQRVVIADDSIVSGKFFTLIGTAKDNRVILSADNFHCLVNGSPEDKYNGKPLEEVLGISLQAVKAFNDRIVRKNIVYDEPIKITTKDAQERSARMYAVAFFNPNNEYVGANIAISANVKCAEDLQRPKDKEHHRMLEYLLSLEQSSTEDDQQIIQEYSQELILLLSSKVNLFGGKQFTHAFFNELERTIHENNLPMSIQNQVIRLPEVGQVDYLAETVTLLLQTAVKFTVGLTGGQNTQNDIREMEKSFSSSALEILDRYHLRPFMVPEHAQQADPSLGA